MRVVGTLLRPLRFISPWRIVRRIVVAVVVLYLAVTFLDVWLTSRRDEARPADAIIVMGAAQYDGRPSPVLQRRLDHALELWRDGIAPLVIVTGGRQEGDRTTEASAAANYLIRKGVPDASIRREVQGSNTYESLAATRRFLRREEVSDVVLVTDAYHAARVRATAREVGLTAHLSPVGDAPGDRLVRETAAVALGRVVGFRRLSSWF